MSWEVAGAVVGAVVSNLFGSFFDNDDDKYQEELLELQKQQIELQKQQIAQELEQNKRTNRYNALDTTSQRTLNAYGEGANLDYYMNAYNAQMNLVNSQIASNYGATVARSATSGFRNSGSNVANSANVASTNKYQYQSQVGQMKSQLSSNGINSMLKQSSYDSQLNSFSNNVQNAIESSNLSYQMNDLETQIIDRKIDYLGAEDNYFGSGRMWSDLFTGAVSTAGNLATSWITYKWLTPNAK